MTTYKPIFCRPIEIQDSTSYYRVNYDVQGGANVNADLDAGTYSSIAALCEGLETAANAAGVGKTIVWEFSDSGGVLKITCRNSSDTTMLNITPGADLANIIGDPATTWNLGYTDYTHTAPYAPEFCWIPQYQNATQDFFAPRLDQNMAGDTMKSGRYVGNKTSSNPIQYKRLRFTNELARNLFNEGATTQESTYSVYEHRNLYKFTECMTWNNQESGNPDARGFFYYPNWNDLIDNPETVPGGKTGIDTQREGVGFNLDSPDFFTYCQFEHNPFQHPTPNAPSGREYYEVEFTIHTIDGMPTWTAPDQSG